MPRVGKGGRVIAGAGEPKPNRSDLQAVKVPTGVRYGEGKELADAQRALPLPSTGGPSTGGAGSPSPVPAGAGPLDQAVQHAAAMPAVSGMGFGSPTRRPAEPVTAGLGVGAGAGPEALATFRPQPSVSGAYAILANQLRDPSLQRLADTAAEQGL